MRLIFLALILFSLASKAQYAKWSTKWEGGQIKVWNGSGWVCAGDSALNLNPVSYYLARANHTGTQLLSTITNGGTTAQYIRGDMSVVTLDKAAVGLANVDNTTDANKPISTATQTALNSKGYIINVQALTSSPADGQTVFFGMLPKAPVTAAATSKVHIRKAGTIKIANIYCYSGTAGSNENWSVSIRINNTTDHLIQTVGASTSERIFTNSSLSIAVVAGDYIEIKCVNPTWGTNPLTTIFGGYIYIE